MTRQTSISLLCPVILAIGFCHLARAADPPAKKDLILPGEVFSIAGKTAFLFTRAGIAVAGIDTGESYGSPEAVQAAEALHAEMVRRGYARKPVLLARSGELCPIERIDAAAHAGAR